MKRVHVSNVFPLVETEKLYIFSDELELTKLFAQCWMSCINKTTYWMMVLTI